MLQRAMPALKLLLAALAEGIGLAALGLLGAHLLYGPVVEVLPTYATLGPALFMGAAVAVYRVACFVTAART